MKLVVRVIPRSSRNKVEKQEDDSYRVYITAPPVDGQANKKTLDLLSKEFGVPKSEIEIIKGKRGRNKVIVIKKSLG